MPEEQKTEDRNQEIKNKLDKLLASEPEPGLKRKLQAMIENQKTEEQKTKNRSQETEKQKIELLERLEALLAREPELSAKLFEALETERFLITVSCQKKDKPDDKHDLRHYWMQRGYNKNDVVSSLKHLAADFIAKENPTAQLPTDAGWH